MFVGDRTYESHFVDQPRLKLVGIPACRDDKRESPGLAFLWMDLALCRLGKRCAKGSALLLAGALSLLLAASLCSSGAYGRRD